MARLAKTKLSLKADGSRRPLLAASRLTAATRLLTFAASTAVPCPRQIFALRWFLPLSGNIHGVRGMLSGQRQHLETSAPLTRRRAIGPQEDTRQSRRSLDDKGFRRHSAVSSKHVRIRWSKRRTSGSADATKPVILRGAVDLSEDENRQTSRKYYRAIWLDSLAGAAFRAMTGRTVNPLVAGSSPARPTTESIA